MGQGVDMTIGGVDAAGWEGERAWDLTRVTFLSRRRS